MLAAPHLWQRARGSPRARGSLLFCTMVCMYYVVAYECVLVACVCVLRLPKACNNIFELGCALTTNFSRGQNARVRAGNLLRAGVLTAEEGPGADKCAL